MDEFTPVVIIHALFALAAVGLGTVNLSMAKGTSLHKIIGWVWIAMMLVVTLSSFDIRLLYPGSFSAIHLLTVWTLLSMGWAIYAVRVKRNIRAHKYAMIGTMAGAMTAGAFTLVPGRLIPQLLFGY